MEIEKSGTKISGWFGLKSSSQETSQKVKNALAFYNILLLDFAALNVLLRCFKYSRIEKKNNSPIWQVMKPSS